MQRFNDMCNHGKECFVGTIKILERHQSKNCESKYIHRSYDVYVFRESFYGHEVCIRYGNKDSEYLSPGPITRIASVSTHEVYRKALELITSKGRFIYERK